MDNENIYCRYCLKPLRSADAKFCPHCGKAQPSAEMHQLPPGTLLHNKIIVGAPLGEGGFGITYLGRDKNLNIPVAVKEYYPYGFVNRVYTVSTQVSCSADDEKRSFFERGRARFLKEAQVLARFSGKRGIVTVHDFFEENNTAYIIMEYLNGKTLKQYTAENGTPAPDGKHRMLTPEVTMQLLTPVMQSLQLLHREGVIHRDISPDNIMVMDDDDVKLLDFGAARVMDGDNKSRSVMLKPGYAPWEQYSSKGDQGPCTDIYALCATIYECVTGQRPPDAPDRMGKDPFQTPTELGVKVPKSMEKALIKGLAVYPEDRYQNIKELMADLQRPDDADEKLSIVYDANGGVYPPKQQEKTPGKALKLSADAPTEPPVFTVHFDACGGDAVPDAAIKREFINWNTKADGSGEKYQPGAQYSRDEDLVLFAQWNYPCVGQLPSASRKEYAFLGWYTDALDGEKIAPELRLSQDITLFAHWQRDGSTVVIKDPVMPPDDGPSTIIVTKAPISKEPPVVEQPVVTTPVIEQPVVKPPVVEQPVPTPQDEEQPEKPKPKKKLVLVIAAVAALLVAGVIIYIILNPPKTIVDPTTTVDAKTDAKIYFSEVAEKEASSDLSAKLVSTLGLDKIEIFDGVTDEEAESWVKTATENGYTQKTPFGTISENEYVLDNAAEKKGFIAGFQYDDNGKKTDRFVIFTAEGDDYDSFIGYDTTALACRWSNWNWSGRFLVDGNVVYGRATDANGTVHLAKMNVGGSNATSLYACDPQYITLLNDDVYFGTTMPDAGDAEDICNIYRLSDTGEPTAILESAADLQVFSGQLLYTNCVGVNERDGVYLCNADGSNKRLLLDGNIFFAYAVGNLLFYQNDDADDKQPDKEFVYNLFTGENREVTDITTYCFVSDGTDAYYSSNVNDTIFAHTLSLTTKDGTALEDAITWGPAFTGNKAFVLKADGQLCRYENGTATPISDITASLLFVLKDKIILVDNDTSNTTFVDLDGSNPVVVTVQ